MDFAIDPVTKKMMLPVQLVTGPAYTRQAVSIRLKFFLGEWFLDLTAGIPYYQRIFKKQQNAKAQIDAIFKDAILGTPTVNSLKQFNSSLINRQYRADWVANTAFGPVEGTWPG